MHENTTNHPGPVDQPNRADCPGLHLLGHDLGAEMSEFVEVMLRQSAHIETAGQSVSIKCLGSCDDHHKRIFWDIRPEKDVLVPCPACVARYQSGKV